MIVRSVGNAFLCALLALCLSGCGGGGGNGDARAVDAEPNPRAGGDTTIASATSEAFGTPAPNLSPQQLDKHLDGDLQFDQSFVSAGNPVNPGLGPIFNNNACVACHRKNGRGHPLDTAGDRSDQFVGKISNTVTGEDGQPFPLQAFGLQLQTDALSNVNAEVNVRINYTERPGEFGDGTSFSLREPSYGFAEPYVALPEPFAFSPRIPPPVFGLGLLEAIPAARLNSLADPHDANGDGISGKIQRVVNNETGRKQIGRFGWKAREPTLRQQTAGAYHRDMGITNPARQTESMVNQNQFDYRDDDPEISEEILDQAAFYVASLAVPARRDRDDTEVRRGERLFNDAVDQGGAGCASCHTPTHETAPADSIGSMLSSEFPDDGENPLAGQTFHPYTDMLLHDMGPDLADGRRVFAANGNEWRTPPLWGIGLTEVISGRTTFLHDGRARSLAEAILWHGGEAEPSKEAFRTMAEAERKALLQFLRSL